MAEIINFFDRVKTKADLDGGVSLPEKLADDDIISAKVLSKEIFFEAMLTLEDMGYDVNENSAMLQDLEALSYLSAAIVFRAHGNTHPGQEMLTEAYNSLKNLADLYSQLQPEVENSDG